MLFFALVIGCSQISGPHANFYVYAATPDGIAQFKVGKQASLNPLAQPPIVFAGGVDLVAVAPDGNHLFGVQGSKILQFTIAGGGVLAGPVVMDNGHVIRGMAVSYDSNFAYVTNDDDTISQYGIRSSGILFPLSIPSVQTISGGAAIAVSPDNNFVYVSSPSGSIGQFRLSAGGFLVPLSPASIDSGEPARDLLVETDGKAVYVVNSNASVSQFRVAAGGQLVARSPAVLTIAGGAGGSNLVMSFDGGFVYASLDVGGSLAQFQVQSDETLAPLTHPLVGASNDPTQIVSFGGDLFVANRSDGTVSAFFMEQSGNLLPAPNPTIPISTRVNSLTAIVRDIPDLSDSNDTGITASTGTATSTTFGAEGRVRGARG